MTTYLYSEIDDHDSFTFDPEVDVLQVDALGVSAAEFSLQMLADGSGVQWSNGVKTFTLTGVSLASLSEENVQFQDGSMLVNSCGANSFATELSGSSLDDLLIGAPTAAPLDIVTKPERDQSPDWSTNSTDVSDNSRFIVFSSSGADLVGGDTNRVDDVFLKDLQTGTLTRISTTSTGGQAEGAEWGGSWLPVISADGRYVAFESNATNLVDGDTNGQYDIFVKDVLTGQVTRASTSADGAQADDGSQYASISADGRYVAFNSNAGNLVAGDNNAMSDVFVKDLVTGEVTLVSSSADGTPVGSTYPATISADGQRVMFSSSAMNLVEGDNDGMIDVFVKDLSSGEVTGVTQDIAGFTELFKVTMSKDGRYATIDTAGEVLHDGLDGWGSSYLKNLQTGEVTRVTSAGSGATAMAVSDDGRYVLVVTDEPLLAGDTNDANDVYVKDMRTGAMARVSVGAMGQQSLGGSYGPSISADGKTISFLSEGMGLVGRFDGLTQVYTVGNPLFHRTLSGGLGNDTYQIDNALDLVVEQVGQGIDTVRASVSIELADNVENLVLTGTAAINGVGNAQNNRVTGNQAGNTLTGGLGADTMTGAGGDDTYNVDHTGDKTIEGAGAEGGVDTVKSSVAHTLQDNVENLTLTGTAVYGTGNSLANVLTGNAANNTLDGGAGVDTMTGGAGNDTYVVDNTQDKTVEAAAGGIDTVKSSLAHTLQDNVENLTLTGTALYGTGNALMNTLVGNAGTNVLDGKAGSDRLTGGGGADTFALTSSLGSDLITDFASGVDRLRLSQAALRIGDGDTAVESAVSVAGPNGFNTSAELVVVTHDIAGALTTASAAAAIGHANGNYAVGDTRLFVVDNGSDSAVYLFESADTNSTVTAGELTLLATLDNTASTTVGDYVFGV